LSARADSTISGTHQGEEDAVFCLTNDGIFSPLFMVWRTLQKTTSIGDTKRLLSAGNGLFFSTDIQFEYR
jgi:hypothetical protein